MSLAIRDGEDGNVFASKFFRRKNLTQLHQGEVGGLVKIPRPKERSDSQ